MCEVGTVGGLTIRLDNAYVCKLKWGKMYKVGIKGVRPCGLNFLSGSKICEVGKVDG